METHGGTFGAASSPRPLECRWIVSCTFIKSADGRAWERAPYPIAIRDDEWAFDASYHSLTGEGAVGARTTPATSRTHYVDRTSSARSGPVSSRTWFMACGRSRGSWLAARSSPPPSSSIAARSKHARKQAPCRVARGQSRYGAQDSHRHRQSGSSAHALRDAWRQAGPHPVEAHGERGPTGKRQEPRVCLGDPRYTGEQTEGSADDHAIALFVVKSPQAKDDTPCGPSGGCSSATSHGWRALGR
jgi:hypothetical protein